MIQGDAKKLLEKIGEPFDSARRQQIFARIDTFAADGKKARLMGAMLKAYLEREWQYNRTPKLTTLQKFVGGDFKIGLLSTFDTPPQTWDATPALGFADGLRNMYMLYFLARDVLERREDFGKEGSRMAKTMAVLLFDDASFPKPEEKTQMDASLGFEVTAPDYCSLKGQEYLARYIRESGYNPFKGLAVAEVGGIKHHERGNDWNNQYFTITLPEAPLMGLLGRYQNSGGTHFTGVGQNNLVSLASQERHFGKEKYDYFVSNMVISHGSGMGFEATELKLSRELVAIGNNITNKKGASLHFGADLMPQALYTPIWEEEKHGEGTRKISRHSNDLLKFIGADIRKNIRDNYVITHGSGRVITREALDAFEAGKKWKEFSGKDAPFAEQVGGEQSSARRGEKSSRSLRPRDE
jgi:hypothetical protein